ncbi:MAG: hypothetical protein HC828_19240 [Blastochloris sp.]|nr:hypothetical protein [Blastochloris sp.]
MQLQIEPQIIVDMIGTAVNFGLSLAWTIIDTIVFIELENPLGEIAIFVAVVSALVGGAYGFKRLQNSL